MLDKFPEECLNPIHFFTLINTLDDAKDDLMNIEADYPKFLKLTSLQYACFNTIKLEIDRKICEKCELSDFEKTLQDSAKKFIRKMKSLNIQLTEPVEFWKSSIFETAKLILEKSFISDTPKLIEKGKQIAALNKLRLENNSNSLEEEYEELRVMRKLRNFFHSPKSKSTLSLKMCLEMETASSLALLNSFIHMQTKWSKRKRCELFEGK
ncbi:MAG: hypothetical protein H0U27_14925 [Nitrosopumilus sp.]|nr:hypothetical protein [Nitrosopumilus sp.]